MNNQIRLIAHRGYSHIAPENTLPAYRLAADHGFWGVECDIWETDDGDLMIMHDANIKRMCGVSVPICKINKSNRGQYPIKKGANIKDYPRLLIPAVEEFLDAIGPCIPVIELKDTDWDSYTFSDSGVQTLNRLLGHRQVLFISFSKSLLLQISAHFSGNGEFYYLMKNKTKKQVKEAIDWCCRNQIHGISLKHVMYDEEIVNYARERGRKTGAWTVNNNREIKRLTTLGIDYITSNKKF